MRCKAIKADGTQCNRNATHGDYCWQHKDLADKPKEPRSTITVDKPEALKAMAEQYATATDNQMLQFVLLLKPMLEEELGRVIQATNEQIWKLQEHYEREQKKREARDAALNNQIREIWNRLDSIDPTVKAKAKAKAARDVKNAALNVRAAAQMTLARLKSERKVRYMSPTGENFTYQGVRVTIPKGVVCEVPESIAKELELRALGRQEAMERKGVLSAMQEDIVVQKQMQEIDRKYGTSSPKFGAGEMDVDLIIPVK